MSFFSFIILFIIVISVIAEIKKKEGISSINSSTASNLKRFSTSFYAKSKDHKNLIVNISFNYYIINSQKISSYKEQMSNIINTNTLSELKNHFSQKTSQELASTSSYQIMKVTDLLNNILGKFGLSVKNVNLKITYNDGINTLNIISKNPKFEKVPCIHTDDKSSLETEFEQHSNDIDEAIKNFELPSLTDNPIKEKQLLKNISLNTLDNTDSNVDPIKDL